MGGRAAEQRKHIKQVNRRIRAAGRARVALMLYRLLLLLLSSSSARRLVKLEDALWRE